MGSQSVLVWLFLLVVTLMISLPCHYHCLVQSLLSMLASSHTLPHHLLLCLPSHLPNLKSHPVTLAFKILQRVPLSTSRINILFVIKSREHWSPFYQDNWTKLECPRKTEVQSLHRERSASPGKWVLNLACARVKIYLLSLSSTTCSGLMGLLPPPYVSCSSQLGTSG